MLSIWPTYSYIVRRTNGKTNSIIGQRTTSQLLVTMVSVEQRLAYWIGLQINGLLEMTAAIWSKNNFITLEILATITLEVVHFHAYAHFPVILPFLNASWKLRPVRRFSNACDSASITSTVSTWWDTEKCLRGSRQASTV